MSEQTTPGGFPYRQHPHDLCGSNTARQEVGDPGHCEDCCSVGHVVAHPDLGCGDVGCYRSHGAELPSAATQTAEQAQPEEFRRFRLNRDSDVSGVSGTGRVADGVVWPDGSASIRWRGERPSVVFWASLDDAVAIHGHGGATAFEWDELDADEVERHVQFHRDNLGLFCKEGHHTRFADVIGDPTDEGWKCPHCVVRDLPAGSPVTETTKQERAGHEG